VRLTADMDHVDEEQFSRSALRRSPAARHARRAAPTAEASGGRGVEGEREEELLGPTGHPQALRVRGLASAECARIRDELQLLAALEVAGVTAAPDVLEIEDDGYVRETAPPLRHRGGRRSAGTGTPPTGERLALARAREALDELVDALHERGWVLGAPPGRGLGARADGTVVVLDLRGLRRDEGLWARQEDRRWVDSVLGDQDRTLRRRVHLRDAAADAAEIALVGVFPQERPEAESEVEPVAPADAQGEPAVSRPPGPNSPTLPTPRRRRREAAAGPGRGVSVVREVVGQPRLRRTALLSGLAMLLCAALVVLGVRWAGERGTLEAGGEQPPTSTAAAPGGDADPAAAPGPGPAPAPRIEDPRILAADIAGARHAYVTGLSEVPAAAPDSPALAEDEGLRTAYAGVEVRGGGPVVHSAELVEPVDSEGTAVLRAVTSVDAHELEAADGEITAVPASAPLAVLLTVHWDGRTWKILDAEPEDAVPADTEPGDEEPASAEPGAAETADGEGRSGAGEQSGRG
jgi:hypothetical protein